MREEGPDKTGCGIDVTYTDRLHGNPFHVGIGFELCGYLIKGQWTDALSLIC